MRENNDLESDYKEKVKMEHDVCVRVSGLEMEKNGGRWC